MKRSAEETLSGFEPITLIREFLLDYGGAPEKTVRNYRDHLEKSLAPFLEGQGINDVMEITTPILRRWITFEANRLYSRGGQEKRVAPNYVKQRRLAAHRLFQWAIEQEYVPEGFNPMSKVKPPKAPNPTRRALSREEAQALINEAGKGWKWIGVRDKAIVTLMIGTGLRSNEVLNLTLKDVDMPRRRIAADVTKGGKGRYAKLGERSYRALQKWLRVRPTSSSDALFLTLQGNALQYGSLHAMLRHVSQYASLEPITPHILRHTFATMFYEETKDLVATKNRLGHASVETTMRYLQSLGVDTGYGEHYRTPDDGL